MKIRYTHQSSKDNSFTNSIDIWLDPEGEAVNMYPPLYDKFYEGDSRYAWLFFLIPEKLEFHIVESFIVSGKKLSTEELKSHMTYGSFYG